ncbi:hypothetical protein SAMN02745165_03723 [Malonomonas rubra DSM 5091]|uniref:Uncharacterized protein n=1 Tax=Malonomonas rubra DSM 5091 TaxID=1122189 RepID=A0A1M6NW49_MALRU|nr:hypothetical protein SAMN02745165_03723 [Malonomonas rubra DSM 5091]
MNSECRLNQKRGSFLADFRLLQSSDYWEILPLKTREGIISLLDQDKAINPPTVAEVVKSDNLREECL